MARASFAAASGHKPNLNKPTEPPLTRGGSYSFRPKLLSGAGALRPGDTSTHGVRVKVQAPFCSLAMRTGVVVGMRVGLSFLRVTNAEANLKAEDAYGNGWPVQQRRLLVHPEAVNLSAENVLSAIKSRLIVSCQASIGDPLNDLDTLRRLAASVLRGGPAGLRAEGAPSVASFRQLTSLPIIGMVKTTDSNGDVYITPTFAAARSVSDAGADIIALDCTRRRLSEPEPWPRLIARIHSELGRLVCADIATLEDALLAQDNGADIVATTLRGYTDDTREIRWVDWPFVQTLVSTLSVPVAVEGHVTSPDEVRRALKLGVHSVVVGSAITRPQTITERFVAATILD